MSTSNDKPHYYRVYGLRVRSFISLPSLVVCDENPNFDISIERAPVLKNLVAAEDTGLRYQTARGKLLLIVDGVARYLALNGERILVDCADQADEKSVRFFLLGPVLGGLMQQREDLVLRGGVIAAGDRAIAFVGPPGVGKSTLIMAFREKGFSLVSDDYCVVRSDEQGRWSAQPGFPQINLWPDSLRKLNLALEQLESIRPRHNKRVVPVPDSFYVDPLPIGKIYLLNSGLTRDVEIKSVASSAACSALEGRPHLDSTLKGLGLEGLHRQMLMAVTRCTPVRSVTRPKRKSSVKELVEQIEADFK